jgi:hypothetical protein
MKTSITYSGFAESLHANNGLTFTTPINEKTGEMKDGVYNASFHNLEFEIYPSGRVLIKGSLHKYYNSINGLGAQNFNDFTIKQVTAALEDLSQRFNIDLAKARLENLEFGVNLIVPFNPNTVLDSLICYKNNSFNSMRIRGQGKGKEVYLQRYGIKMYNKALQFNQPENILRFERKVYKMDSIGQGVIYLTMLTSVDFSKICFDILTESFKDIIITEPVTLEALSKPQKKIYERCGNPRNWYAMTRNQRYKNRLLYNAIIDQYSELKLKSTILQLLKSKGAQLINVQKRVTFDPAFQIKKGDVRSVQLVG